MTHQLRDIMTSDVVTVNGAQTIQEAASLMSQYNIGSIPVVDESGNLQGIITDRDITLRSTAAGDKPHTFVKDVMSTNNLVSATPDMGIEEAAQLMAKQQIRRLPVLENQQLVGVVSLGDLAVHQEHDQKAGAALASISTPSTPQQNQF